MTSCEDISPRLSLVPILLLMAAVSAPAVTAQTQPANETRIVVTAVDRQQHFVDMLRAEDLRILENGAAQKIVSLQRIIDQPVSLAILIDTSASQEQILPGEKLAATFFVDSIIQPLRDEAAVATFTGTLTVEQKLTNDLTVLRQAITRAQFIPPPGYVRGRHIIGPPPLKRTHAALAFYTAVWDAVVAACDELLSQSSAHSRPAIILLTDGEDSISKNKLSDAVERAIRTNACIYSIGLADTFPFGIDKDALRKLSERTGGRAFFPKKPAVCKPFLPKSNRNFGLST